MKIKHKLVASILSIILLVNLINAFGVASPYWKGNPLSIYPGQESNINLYLQNMGTTEDVNVRVDLVEGKEVATLMKNEFLVKAGTKDTAIPIRVIIPAGDSIGKIYSIKLSTKTITPGGTGVVLGTGMDTSFEVLVVAKPEPIIPVSEPIVQESPQKSQESASSNGLVWLTLVIIFVAIIVILYFKKKAKVEIRPKKKAK